MGLLSLFLYPSGILVRHRPHLRDPLQVLPHHKFLRNALRELLHPPVSLPMAHHVQVFPPPATRDPLKDLFLLLAQIPGALLRLVNPFPMPDLRHRARCNLPQVLVSLEGSKFCVI